MSRALRSVPPSAAVAELRRLFAGRIGETFALDLVCAPRHGPVSRVLVRSATLRVVGIASAGDAVDLRCVATGRVVHLHARDVADDGWQWIDLREGGAGVPAGELASVCVVLSEAA